MWTVNCKTCGFTKKHLGPTDFPMLCPNCKVWLFGYIPEIRKNRLAETSPPKSSQSPIE